MKLGTSKNDWVNVLNEENNSNTFQNFSDFKSVIEGKGFIVVWKSGGWIEVYDKTFRLISQEVFLNVKKIKADDMITVIMRDGWCEVYDKLFNIKSVKYLGA